MISPRYFKSGAGYVPAVHGGQLSQGRNECEIIYESETVKGEEMCIR